MGGSVLQFSSAFIRPNLRNPFVSPKEIRIGPSSVKAVDGNGGRSPRKNPSTGRARKAVDNNISSRSLDDEAPSLSPNKEEILALFKRIQSSISKGEALNPGKKSSKVAAEDNGNNRMSAESILEVLHQSRTGRKGKTTVKKGDKLVGQKKDSPKKEEETVQLKSTRLPSQFTRRSPIPTPSSPRNEAGSKIERLVSRDDKTGEGEKFEEMKLAQLKEVAKSKGIKGYSKLKKSELVELLVGNGV